MTGGRSEKTVDKKEGESVLGVEIAAAIWWRISGDVVLDSGYEEERETKERA